MKSYEEMIKEIDAKIAENENDIFVQLPGVKYIEIGKKGLKKIYGICKAKDFHVQADTHKNSVSFI